MLKVAKVAIAMENRSMILVQGWMFPKMLSIQKLNCVQLYETKRCDNYLFDYGNYFNWTQSDNLDCAELKLWKWLWDKVQQLN